MQWSVVSVGLLPKMDLPMLATPHWSLVTGDWPPKGAG